MKRSRKVLVEIPEAAAVGVVGRKNARPNANVNALYVTYGTVFAGYNKLNLASNAFTLKIEGLLCKWH